MRAISKVDLYSMNYLSEKAVNEKIKCADIMKVIQTKIDKHSFNNNPVRLYIPYYWAATVSCMVDDIIRMAPAAKFMSIADYLAGLQVKVDGFDPAIFDSIKQSVQRAQDRVDYLVQKRINEHIALEA